MKLEPKAKPVRIRIKSGGEEHFNLESLKQNFSVQDLWESVVGGSLSRWLRQQNESELAEKVEAFCKVEKPSTEDYIKFSSLFFEKEMKGVSNDANALVKFYKERNLKKNFQYAFPYLLHSLDYQSGKVWFDEYKETKSTEDWITFFDAKLPQLQGEEEIECYQFLCKLHSVNNDLAKMEYCQSKVKDSIVSLAKKDKCSLDKWLASGNYFYAKLLFENEITRGLKNNSAWIGIFDATLPQLQGEEEIECYQFLYKLHSVNNDSAKMNYCQLKVKDSIISLAKKDNEWLDKCLASGSYFYAKLLFENEITRGLKSNNDWIGIFDATLPQLQGEEEIECYQFLYKLHSVNNDSEKMKYCQSKVKDSIISFAKKDKGRVDKWLASGNYFYANLLFNDEMIRSLKSNSDWIGVFERCKSQILVAQQAECFHFLYLLYKANGEETKAKEYLEKSANLGYAEAIKKMFEVKYSFPKLTEIFNHYRSEKIKIGFSAVHRIIHDHNLIEIEKEDEYYTLCKYLLMQLEDAESEVLRDGLLFDVNAILRSVCASIDAKTSRFPKYESIIVLIGALCGEYRITSNITNKAFGGSFSKEIEIYKKLDERIKDDSPYKLIFQLKLSGQKETIVAEKGLKCDLRTASIVEQVIFFLETHGESYSVMR